MKNWTSLIALLCLSVATSTASGQGTTQPAGQDDASQRASKTKLLYYAGGVIAKVKVMAVYWGPSVNPQTAPVATPFLGALANSTYMDLLKEYDTDIKGVNGQNGTGQSIVRGALFNSKTITPKNMSNTLTDDDVIAELQYQFSINGLTKPNYQSVYVVFFPPGVSITSQGQTTCQNICGYHSQSTSQSYGLLNYVAIPDLGGSCSSLCGSGAPADVLTSVVSRHFIDTIVNPGWVQTKHIQATQAWVTKTDQQMGDLCSTGQVGQNTTLTSGATTFAVQMPFDNHSHACKPGPYTSP